MPEHVHLLISEPLLRTLASAVAMLVGVLFWP